MARTATAALLRGPQTPFEISKVEVDDPRPGEVLVRVRACGLCHSDLLVQDGTTPSAFPAVLGHEGAGVVEAVGADVSTVAVGDHVVLQSASCGHCRNCRGGRPSHCQSWLELNLLRGERTDGSPTLRHDGRPVRGRFFGQSSMATYALAEERTVVPVRRDADLALLGPLGCSVQTGAQAVLNVLRPPAGSTVLVVGAGAVGLCAVMAAAGLTGATVIAVDVHPARLALAEELGAAHVVDARVTDQVAAVRGITGGAGADFALEASGAAGALRRAMESLAPLGVCGVISAGTFTAETTLQILPFISEGLTLVGINQGEVVARDSIPALLDLHLAGRLPFDRLLRSYPLAEVEAAAEDACAGRVVKPVLLMP